MGHSASPTPIATIIPRPCPGDAIGGALREAFLRDGSVPDDMMVLLARMNGGDRLRRTGTGR